MTPKTLQVSALSGEYKVIAPEWATDAELRGVVEQLERDGAIPFRSMSRGGFGVALEIGGEEHEVELQDRQCSVTIFGRTIGIITE